jgi:adenylyltransferase/sulfurtransferase
MTRSINKRTEPLSSYSFIAKRFVAVLDHQNQPKTFRSTLRGAEDDISSGLQGRLEKAGEQEAAQGSVRPLPTDDSFGLVEEGNRTLQSPNNHARVWSQGYKPPKKSTYLPKQIGQERLGKSSVLVVGAGGLGSPAALYLVASGIKKLGIVDYDTVELDNLHRQVIHGEDRMGMTKVDSAKLTLQQLNSNCEIVVFNLLLDRFNISEIIRGFDIIVDASDNAATRYLVNDAAVLVGVPLVSGAALRFDGQLTTYNFNGSPCYRCMYPDPPPVAAVVNCQFGGVLGPVTGIIGSLQALEVIRIITMNESNYAGKLLKFDGLTGMFRTFKLRGKNSNCVVCGDSPLLKKIEDEDYEQFCGSKADDKCQDLLILSADERLSCNDFVKVRERVAVIDVRPPGHFDIVRLPEAINIPLDLCEESFDRLRMISQEKDIVMVCRAGNDSQIATRQLKESGIRNVKDLVGGMNAFAAQIDKSLPRY